jgi:hypothetical protein
MMAITSEANRSLGRDLVVDVFSRLVVNMLRKVRDEFPRCRRV